MVKLFIYLFFWQKENSCFILSLMIILLTMTWGLQPDCYPRKPAGFSLSESLDLALSYNPQRYHSFITTLRSPPSFITVVLRGNEHVKHLHGTSRCLWDPWSLLISSCTNRGKMELATMFHTETERINPQLLSGSSHLMSLWSDSFRAGSRDWEAFLGSKGAN